MKTNEQERGTTMNELNMTIDNFDVDRVAKYFGYDPAYLRKTWDEYLKECLYAGDPIDVDYFIGVADELDFGDQETPIWSRTAHGVIIEYDIDFAPTFNDVMNNRQASFLRDWEVKVCNHNGSRNVPLADCICNDDNSLQVIIVEINDDKKVMTAWLAA